MRSLLPQAKQTLLVGAQTLTTFPGWEGPAPDTILTDYASGMAYLVSHSQRRIETRTLVDLGPQALLLPEARYRETDTVETLLGRHCNVYRGRLDMPSLGGEVYVELWMARGLKLACDTSQAPFGPDTSFSELQLVSGCLGFPLKRIIRLPMLQLELIEAATQVTEIQAAPAFTLPDGYDRVPFNPDRELD